MRAAQVDTYSLEGFLRIEVRDCGCGEGCRYTLSLSCFHTSGDLDIRRVSERIKTFARATVSVVSIWLKSFPLVLLVPRRSRLADLDLVTCYAPRLDLTILTTSIDDLSGRIKIYASDELIIMRAGQSDAIAKHERAGAATRAQRHQVKQLTATLVSNRCDQSAR